MTLCDPMNYTMPDFPGLHHLPGFAQTLSIVSQMPSSVIPFSSCLQCFPVSWTVLLSRLFASGCHNIVASASVLLMNFQDCFPVGLTGLICLQSKGLSRVFSNNRIQKYQFFGIQPSLWSNSHIHT